MVLNNILMLLFKFQPKLMLLILFSKQRNVIFCWMIMVLKNVNETFVNNLIIPKIKLVDH